MGWSSQGEGVVLGRVGTCWGCWEYGEGLGRLLGSVSTIAQILAGLDGGQ